VTAEIAISNGKALGVSTGQQPSGPFAEVRNACYVFSLPEPDKP
jgi:hypothetical protein